MSQYDEQETTADEIGQTDSVTSSIVTLGSRAEVFAVPDCDDAATGLAPMVVKAVFREGKLVELYGKPAVPDQIEVDYVLAGAYWQMLLDSKAWEDAAAHHHRRAQSYETEWQRGLSKLKELEAQVRSANEENTVVAQAWANEKLELLGQIESLGQTQLAITEELAAVQAANDELLTEREGWSSEAMKAQDQLGIRAAELGQMKSDLDCNVEAYRILKRESREEIDRLKGEITRQKESFQQQGLDLGNAHQAALNQCEQNRNRQAEQFRNEIAQQTKNIKLLTDNEQTLKSRINELSELLSQRKTVKEFTQELAEFAVTVLPSGPRWLQFVTLLQDFDGTTAEVQAANLEADTQEKGNAVG